MMGFVADVMPASAQGTVVPTVGDRAEQSPPYAGVA